MDKQITIYNFFNFFFYIYKHLVVMQRLKKDIYKYKKKVLEQN